MATFWESLHLIKYDRTQGPIIIRKFPVECEELEEKQSFLNCSFPESNQTRNSIYSFSIPKRLCHTWEFQQGEDLYSFVIVTRNCLSFLFLEFLKSCKKSSITMTTDERFDMILDLLNKWKFEGNYAKIHVFYPDSDFIADIEQDHVFYQQFDPSAFISQDTKVIEEIIKSILTNKGVLLVGDTAEMVSSAGYALMSLFEPMKFSENYLLYTRYGDQRFADVINGEKKWKFVCTTNQLAVERCKQFKTVVIVPKRSNQIIPEIKQTVHKKMGKLLKRIENLFNRNLEIDPYSDIINKPLTKEQIEEISPALGLNAKEMEIFTESNMIKEWRSNMIVRPQLRESLLSNMPGSVVEKHTDEELAIAYKFLLDTKKRVKGDKHIKAVVSLHIKLIRERLKDKPELLDE